MKGYALPAPASLAALKLVDLPDPGEPGPGEIRVRIRANSLNFHDLGVAVGKMKVRDGHVPLADASGFVEAVGPGVAGFAIGEHVISHFFPGWTDGEPTVPNFSTSPGDGVDGYGREVAVVPAHYFTRAPAGYTYAEAATVPVAAVTAWRALVTNGALKPGESVLVLGSGGVSIFALQFAKAMGARVIATSSSDDKIQRLKALGADQTINYKDTPDWGEAVLDLTHGRGVDHVLEVGGAGTFGQSIRAVRTGGHISMIGVLSGSQGDVSLGAVTMKQVALRGLVVGSKRHQLETIRAIEQIGLRPQIDSRFPLSELRSAFEHQAAKAHFGKIVIEH